MQPLDAKQVEQRYHSLAASGDYAGALELVTRHFELFPHHAQAVVYYWRIKMACKLGNASLALDTLQQAVEVGHWYDDLGEEEDLAILGVSERFQQLVAVCNARRQAAIDSEKPVMQVLKPSEGAGPHPLVFGLHGNNSSAAFFEQHWEPAVRQGWLVALPQAPQAYGPDKFSWNDWGWARQSLRKQLAQLREEEQVDATRTVLAGFSMGAGLALWLGLEGALAAKGVLCVAPFLSEVEALEPLLAALDRPDFRIYLVASPGDKYCHQVAVRLSGMLTSYGIEHRLDLYEDVGHAFPAPFRERIPAALEYLLHGS
jgi:predicted esterase